VTTWKNRVAAAAGSRGDEGVPVGRFGGNVEEAAPGAVVGLGPLEDGVGAVGHGPESEDGTDTRLVGDGEAEPASGIPGDRFPPGTPPD
jgi:hypothetical protein